MLYVWTRKMIVSEWYTEQKPITFKSNRWYGYFSCGDLYNNITDRHVNWTILSNSHVVCIHIISWGRYSYYIPTYILQKNKQKKKTVRIIISARLFLVRWSSPISLIQFLLLMAVCMLYASVCVCVYFYVVAMMAMMMMDPLNWQFNPLEFKWMIHFVTRAYKCVRPTILSHSHK